MTKIVSKGGREYQQSMSVDNNFTNESLMLQEDQNHDDSFTLVGEKEVNNDDEASQEENSDEIVGSGLNVAHQ